MAENVLEEMRNRVFAMLEQGLTPREIRWRIDDVSPSLISVCRRKLGLPKFSTGRPTLIENLEIEKEVSEMLRAGKRPIEIRRLIKVYPAFITRCREKLKRRKFKRGPARDRQRVRRARKMRRLGLTYQEIGNALGVSRQRATQIVA